MAEQRNHHKPVEKTEAITRLNAANLGHVARELENWRAENGTDQGWDGWIKGAHPEVVEVIGLK